MLTMSIVRLMDFVKSKAMDLSYSLPTASLLVFQSHSILLHGSFTSRSKASDSARTLSHQMGGFPCLHYFLDGDILGD